MKSGVPINSIPHLKEAVNNGGNVVTERIIVVSERKDANSKIYIVSENSGVTNRSAQFCITHDYPRLGNQGSC